VGWGGRGMGGGSRHRCPGRGGDSVPPLPVFYEEGEN